MAARKEETLYSAFGLSKELGRVDFSLVVKLSTGFDVIPINRANPSDNTVIDLLNGILKNS
ncbi:MAG: hypothetical protein M3Y53_03495 [Thermoproteota archaeon]|nr:hypothetical protein [Thermoproteota archaeon]